MSKGTRAILHEMLPALRRIAHYARENVERQGTSDAQAVAHQQDAESLLIAAYEVLNRDPEEPG